MFQQVNISVELGFLGEMLELLNENTVHLLIANEEPTS